MTEVEQQPPPQNGIDLTAAEEDDSSKARPADIEQVCIPPNIAHFHTHPFPHHTVSR